MKKAKKKGTDGCYHVLFDDIQFFELQILKLGDDECSFNYYSIQFFIKY